MLIFWVCPTVLVLVRTENKFSRGYLIFRETKYAEYCFDRLWCAYYALYISKVNAVKFQHSESYVFISLCGNNFRFLLFHNRVTIETINGIALRNTIFLIHKTRTWDIKKELLTKYFHVYTQWLLCFRGRYIWRIFKHMIMYSTFKYLLLIVENNWLSFIFIHLKKYRMILKFGKREIPVGYICLYTTVGQFVLDLLNLHSFVKNAFVLGLLKLYLY